MSRRRLSDNQPCCSTRRAPPRRIRRTARSRPPPPPQSRILRLRAFSGLRYCCCGHTAAAPRIRGTRRCGRNARQRRSKTAQCSIPGVPCRNPYRGYPRVSAVQSRSRPPTGTALPPGREPRRPSPRRTPQMQPSAALSGAAEFSAAYSCAQTRRRTPQCAQQTPPGAARLRPPRPSQGSGFYAILPRRIRRPCRRR